MSPKTAAILSPTQRREIIQENIINHDYTEIATLCNCTIRTIKRDVRKWREEGGFEEFLLDEFFRSYPEIKQNFPDKAFDRLCYLLGKSMPRRIEQKTEVSERIGIIVKMWKPDDSTERSDLPVLASQTSRKIPQRQI